MEARPAKSKKRKLDKVSHVEKQPTEKKSKKKSLTEGDEQWQKFIKLQQGGATSSTAKKKAGGTTTTTTTTNEKKSTKEDKKKKKKKSNPLLKQREPCDLMRNEARAQELSEQVIRIEDINETNHAQKALAVHIMPARERQTVDTLALGIEHHKMPAVSFNDVDFSIAMKKLNYERSAARGFVPQAYPLQDLMGDHGFLSINNEHVEHVLKCIIKDKRNDISYAKYAKADAAKLPRIKGSNASVPGGDTSNKKLNHIFGNNFHSFGYNRRTPQQQHKKMKALDNADRQERFKEFFKFDELEDGDDETNYGEAPSNFRMFRALKREHGEKFKRRNEALRDSAALTPKADLEELSKEYILEFRQPPATGDALCANGVRCIFNTFSSDKTACYIGKVFYTERERAKREGVDNEGRLCYDCLIKSWTIQWALNIRDEVIPERPINYFTVMCKPGQYSPHCMLSRIENNKPTGIIGHVPRFSLNNRRIVTYQRSRRYENRHETISVPVLVETGMDF